MRIVLIDDCADDRALSAMALRSGLPEADIVPVVDALAYAEVLSSAATCDVAIGDLQVRWADGARALLALRARNPRMVLIALSRPAHGEPAEALPDAGFDASIAKTSRGLVNLATSVRAALARRVHGNADCLLDSLPVAAAVLDAGGCIERVNATFLALLDLPATEPLAGRLLDTLLTDPGVKAELAAARKARRPLERIETTLATTRDGSVRVSLWISAMEEADRWLVVLHDVSAFRQVEAELREQAIALGRSNDELEVLTYAVGHDLQEPVQLIAGHARLLLEHHAEALDEEARRSLRHIEASAARMREMLAGAIDFARAGRRDSPHSDIDLGALIDGLATELTAERPAASIEHGPLPVLRGDLPQLTRLFRNLLGNALKFCRAQAPRVRVQAEQVDAQWHIDVIDNGIGIAAADTARVFTLFARLHTGEEYPGTGIGLALCKRIAEAHGGSIGARPNPTGGAVFTLSLPCTRPKCPPTSGTARHTGERP